MRNGTLKNLLKRFASQLGFEVVSLDRLGFAMEHDLHRLTLDRPIVTIFDVGGNFGQTAVRFATAFPAAVVLTFEPVPSSFAKLLHSVNGNERVKAFNLALGASSGRVIMHLCDDPGRNSVMGDPLATQSIQVAMSTVDAMAQEQGIETIDLLKIDVEGYELPVLAGAHDLIKAGRVRFIYAGCVFSSDASTPHTSFFELHSALDRDGYCFVGYYAESFHLQNGCALGNVLYAYRSSLPAQVDGKVRNIW